MLLFCPRCGNMLIISENIVANENIFSCMVCQFIFKLDNSFCFNIYPKLKEIDDVLGGSEAWKNVDSINAQCLKCGNDRAYFMQIQTRSADEPMTTFYRCCKCSYRWKE